MYKNSMDEIDTLIKSFLPIIWVVTNEEERFIEDFYSSIAQPNKRKVWTWSTYCGLVQYKGAESSTIDRAAGDNAGTHDPRKALAQITSNKQNDIYIMRDMHTVLVEPVPRQMKDSYDYLISAGKNIIIVSPTLAHGRESGLPPSLEKQISVVRYELPNHEQVMAHIKQGVDYAISSGKISRDSVSEGDIEVWSRVLQGLTLTEIDDAITTSFTYNNNICIDHLLNAKKQVIRKSDVLEYIEPSVKFEDVGGLDIVKQYFTKYSKMHSKEARDFGVEPLKGVFLTGIPGTGKSLTCKMAASLLKLPLLRFDVGRVMQGVVGASENRMRETLAQAESMAPCLLWIDEIEKALAGLKSSNQTDGGTFARVFGALLSAMQEGLSGVTILATANDVSSLPPELIRRFDEGFFVDLPNEIERLEIAKIHIAKRGIQVDIMSEGKEEFLRASDRFTGAEIEKAVKAAVANAFYAGDSKVEAKHIISAFSGIKPISETMSEQITQMREMAKGHFNMASSPEVTQNNFEGRLSKVMR